MSGEMHLRFQAVNAKYGSMARIGPNLLITTDHHLIRRMNAPRSQYTRSEWYQALRFHPSRDNIASYRDEQKHTRLRSQMALGYSGKENLFLEQDIDNRLLLFINLIRKKYISTNKTYQELDLARGVAFLTLDIISQLAFGKPFGFTECDEDRLGYIKQVQNYAPILTLFTCLPELHNFMRLPLMQKFAPKATDAAGLGRAMGVANAAVAERFGPNPVIRKDMLGSFLSHGLTREQLESETLTQILAGADTSSTAIRMTIFYITTNPSVYNKLMEELTTALRAGQLTRPVLRDTEARQLPYLQACLKEALRVNPPVVGLSTKLSPPEGDWVDVDGKQMRVPGGVQIALNFWGVMRNESVFGPDAELFRPERWLTDESMTSAEELEQEKKRLDAMNEASGLVFGSGRFTCLGKSVAVLELNKIVPELLLRFDFRIAKADKPYLGNCFGFFMHSKLNYRVTEREGMFKESVLDEKKEKFAV